MAKRIKQERHGKYRTPEYNSWRKAKERCYNKNHNRYKYYGEKKITMCDRWLNSFSAFYEDMGNKPFPKYHLDRILNSGNYCKSNCQWLSPKDNLRKKTNTLRVKQVLNIRELLKQGKTDASIAREFNVHRSTVWSIKTGRTWKDVC